MFRTVFHQAVSALLAALLTIVFVPTQALAELTDEQTGATSISTQNEVTENKSNEAAPFSGKRSSDYRVVCF